MRVVFPIVSRSEECVCFALFRVRFVLLVDAITLPAAEAYVAAGHADTRLERLRLPDAHAENLWQAIPERERLLFWPIIAPMFFPLHRRVALLDTDILVLRDPAELWAHFQHLGGEHIFGITVESQPSYFRCPKYGFSLETPGVNAGVVLINLSVWREAYVDMFAIVAQVFQNFGCAKGLSAQNAYNILYSVEQTRRFFYILPLAWNLQLSVQIWKAWYAALPL